MRDQLMNAIEITQVKDSVKDRVPRTAQQLVNRVANRLSEKPRTVGEIYAYLATRNRRAYRKQSKDTMAHYTLDQHGTAEQRKVK